MQPSLFVRRVRTMKKRICYSLLTLLAALLLFSTTASAAKPSIGKTKKIYATKYPVKGENWEAAGIYKIKNLAKNAVISDIETSDEKVYAAMLTKEWTSWNDKYKGLLYVSVYGISPGKTFTVKLKVAQGGKKYTVRTTFKVFRKPSPFKSFTINGKEYADRFKGTTAVFLPLSDYAGKKVKVKWELNSGVKNVSEDGTISVYHGSDFVRLKNGGSIRIKKGKDNYDLLSPLHFTDLEMEGSGKMPNKYEIFLK